MFRQSVPPYGAQPYGPGNAQIPNPMYEIDRMRRFAAEQRSFTTHAVITLVLYCVLWIPGLIANIVYLQEARKIERITGRSPEGMGCLWALLIVVCLPLLAICAWLAIAVAAS